MTGGNSGRHTMDPRPLSVRRVPGPESSIDSDNQIGIRRPLPRIEPGYDVAALARKSRYHVPRGGGGGARIGMCRSESVCITRAPRDGRSVASTAAVTEVYTGEGFR